jgi:hypothetical protein
MARQIDGRKVDKVGESSNGGIIKGPPDAAG